MCVDAFGTGEERAALERLLKKRFRDKKISFQVASFNNIYLPSLPDVLALLRLPNSSHGFISKMEKISGKRLGLSRAYKFSVGKGGVGMKSFKKILQWAYSLPIPPLTAATSASYKRGMRYQLSRSNGGLWVSVISGLKIELDRHGNHEFNLLFEFINQRSEIDAKFQRELKRKVKKREIDKTDLDTYWLAQMALWHDESLVPEEYLDRFSNALSQTKDLSALSKHQEAAILTGLLHMRLDFYLSAIANYELGVLVLQRKGDVDIKKLEGFLSLAIKAYAENNDAVEHTVFSCLLQVWKNRIFKMSWGEIATFIPIKEDTSVASGDSLKDKQKNRLKDWRKGSPPSMPLLAEFLNGLLGATQKTGEETLLIYCRIAIMLDKLLAKYVQSLAGADLNQEDLRKYVNVVFQYYPVYYKHFLDRYLAACEAGY